MTMAKKFASGTGTRSGSLATASASDTPSAWVSEIVRNSLLTGSAASLAMILMQSLSGRPALTPRTMTSTALANSSRNLRDAALAQEVDDPARQAEKRRRRRRRRRRRAARRRTRRPRRRPAPQTTLMMKKVRRLHDRPACWMRSVERRRAWLCLALAFCFASISFSVSWIDLRRLRRVDRLTAAARRRSRRGSCPGRSRGGARRAFSLLDAAVEQARRRRRRRSAWRARRWRDSVASEPNISVPVRRRRSSSALAASSAAARRFSSLK